MTPLAGGGRGRSVGAKNEGKLERAFGSEGFIPDKDNYHESEISPELSPKSSEKAPNLAQLIDGLSTADLVSLRRMLDFVLKSADSSQRGHVETKYHKHKDKVYGPYLYLRWWEDGKHKSKYLGKAQVA